ncbi:MAG: FlgD immunoglobulin-like domain containing protein, partial [Candidatus Cloacimonetes bacterium]|nr:FlgD immunoglobulin-like domain containing protein [Candidatus Cloacimonadota bacterium]
HPSQAFEYNAGYPATFAPNTFIHEVLGISGVDYYTAARFKYALGGLDQDFASISVDSLKIPVSFNGHLFHVEGLVPASGAETLYTYGSNYASSTTQGIQNGQVVGVLNSYGAGKAITLSFPMYYMDYALSLVVMEDAFSGVFNEEVSLDDNINPAVKSIYLAPNYPNPFASESRIPYKTNDLIHPIKVQIFNLKGQVVKTLFEGNPDKSNSLLWDGKDASGKAVANGVYYIKASQNGTVQTRKMVLVK